MSTDGARDSDTNKLVSLSSRRTADLQMSFLPPSCSPLAILPAHSWMHCGFYNASLSKAPGPGHGAPLGPAPIRVRCGERTLLSTGSPPARRASRPHRVCSQPAPEPCALKEAESGLHIRCLCN